MQVGTNQNKVMRARLLAMLVSLSVALGGLGLVPLMAFADEADQLVVAELAEEQGREVAVASEDDSDKLTTADAVVLAEDDAVTADETTATADAAADEADDSTEDEADDSADATTVETTDATPSGEQQATETPSADESVAGEQEDPQASVISAAEATSFAYRHDPLDNPTAMRDAVVNPNAPYGFSPSPDGRLAAYANADWTNAEAVAGWRKERIAYHASMAELYFMVIVMDYKKASTEEIARAVSQRRNELRLESYKNDPEGLARMKQRNLEVYGNEMGGTPEYFYEKYGSWDKVIWGSVSVNSGMDACLGLYDDFYRLYAMSGQVPMDTVLPEDRGGENNPLFPYDPDAPTPVAPGEGEGNEPDQSTPVDSEPAVQPTADAAQPVAETQAASVTQGRESTPAVAAAAAPAKALPATGDEAQGNEAALLMGLSTLLLCVGSALRREERKAA